MVGKSDYPKRRLSVLGGMLASFISFFLYVQYRGMYPSYLDKANIGRLLTEALTADVQAVLADQTSLVGADSAIEYSC